MTSYSLPQLPAMRCDDGCGECCGIVMCTRQEYEQLARVVKAKKITPLRQGVTCPLFIGGRCSVYEARPVTCRLFGHVAGMQCPRGYNANTTADIERRYQKAATRGGANNARVLHEMVYSGDEIMAILAEETKNGTNVGA